MYVACKQSHDQFVLLTYNNIIYKQINKVHVGEHNQAYIIQNKVSVCCNKFLKKQSNNNIFKCNSIIFALVLLIIITNPLHYTIFLGFFLVAEIKIHIHGWNNDICREGFSTYVLGSDVSSYWKAVINKS